MTSNPMLVPQKLFRPPKENEIIAVSGRRFFIGNKLGEGGFGAVYNCVDEWLNELVAKVIVPKGQAYSEIKSMWQKELKNLVALRHPNITFVYDAFEFKDTFYIIIERCRQTLKDLINWPDLKGDVWIQPIARDILQAIHFIHEFGYIHKDIHPGNVFLKDVKDSMVPDKDPITVFKIGDLGISNMASEVDVFGTILAQWMLPPEYLAPQHFGTLNRQIDIYHAGLLFLNLLVNPLPQFSRDEILDGAPRKLAESVNSQFSFGIAKALRRHLKDRTQTALELWNDIFQY